MSVQVGRQLRIDEDILGWNDDQLLSLVWMGLMSLQMSPDEPVECALRRRLRVMRDEVERRGLLSDEMMQKFDARLS